MHEDLLDHPLIKLLLETGPSVPVEDIENLAQEIRNNEGLARRCNHLLRLETSFNPSAGTYFMIWLAFSLALAQDEKAFYTFIDLFEWVDPIEHDMLWELAQYALWQYGDKAVREVLEDFSHVLEIDHTGYFLGVLEVAGLSQDQLLRRRLSDRVMEALRSPKTPPAALMSLVDIAMILEDKRLPSVLNEWEKRLPPQEKQTLDEVKGLLFSTDPHQRKDEFRLKWSELAEFSAEHFEIHMEAMFKLASHSDDAENLTQEFTRLAESFRRSSRFLEIPKPLRRNPEKVIVLLISIFSHLFESMGRLPEEVDAAEVSVLMKDVLPRRMVADTSSFKPIAHVLTAFFLFLTDGYSKEEGQEYERCIRSAEYVMLQRASDPESWDRDKRRAMEKEGR